MSYLLRSCIVWTIALIVNIICACLGAEPTWLNIFILFAGIMIIRWSEYFEERMMKNLTKGTRCDRCITDKSDCQFCRDYYKYYWAPTTSRFTACKPTCPRGYKDCVHDPAYIQFNYPDWYKELYGNVTPEVASAETCRHRVVEDPDMEYYCYDDEDK